MYYHIPLFLNAPGGITFCIKSAKRLFILFCQFLLGKKNIWGPEGGGGVYKSGGVKSGVYGIFMYM